MYKVYVHPHISDIAIIHEVFKGGVFEFIGCGRGITNSWVVFCGSYQDYFWFVSVYNTRMKYANVMKKALWK